MLYRYCLDAEIQAYPELSGAKDDKSVCVFYFGSQDVGVVKNSNIIPYKDNYDRLVKKNKTLKYKLGIEQAEETMLKSLRKLLCMFV